MTIARVLFMIAMGLLVAGDLHAQRVQVAVKAQRSAKLSPELTAARSSGGLFLGRTRGGDAVIELDRADLDVQQRINRNKFTAPPARYEPLDQLIVMYYPGRAPTQASLKSAGLVATKNHARYGFMVIRPQDKGISTQSLTSLEANPDVRYVEPDYPIFLEPQPVAPSRPKSLATLSKSPSNDPGFADLWGMENIGVIDAWKQVKDTGVIVAVIDTGVDYNHEDLRDNMWNNPGEIPGNGQDDDGNGFVDDIYGYDFANDDADPMDEKGHGTHCAGTIAAVGNNAKGVVGVCWNAKIMALRFLGQNGGKTSDAILSIRYAVENGARVLSNSWGGGGESKALEEAIWAAERKGALVVAAAGNEAANNDEYANFPANYPNANIISVAAIDWEDKLAKFSCFGQRSVDIGAPGVDVYSTVIGDKYKSYNGTSMATPHVSGAAALLWAHPYCQHRGYAEIKHLLLSNARPIEALNGKCATAATLSIEFLNKRNLDSGPIMISSVPTTAPASAITSRFGASVAPGAGGVRVASVTAGGAAELAGFESDDLIVAVNDQLIASPADFSRAVAASNNNMRVRVRNMRDGSVLEVKVQLPDQPPSAATTVSTSSTSVPENVTFGVQAQQTSEGLKITRVLENSPAGLAGFEVNDTIVAINGHELRSEAEYSRAVDTSSTTMMVGVKSWRDQKIYDVEVQLGGPRSASRNRNVVFGAQAVAAGGGGGVKLTRVLPGSPADDAGLDPGDVILKINGQPINSEADYSAAVDQSTNAMSASIVNGRDGSVMDVQVRLNK